jgi:hypothetical protein
MVVNGRCDRVSGPLRLFAWRTTRGGSLMTPPDLIAKDKLCCGFLGAGWSIRRQQTHTSLRGGFTLATGLVYCSLPLIHGFSEATSDPGFWDDISSKILAWHVHADRLHSSPFANQGTSEGTSEDHCYILCSSGVCI